MKPSVALLYLARCWWHVCWVGRKGYSNWSRDGKPKVDPVVCFFPFYFNFLEKS